MRLWHDDVRPAPLGWVWARTNDEAKEYLLTGEVEAISMDHDLGLHDIEIPDDHDERMDVLILKGQSEDNGLVLAKWMAENEIIPKKITIHSWNASGAMSMAVTLAEAGGEVMISPFRI